MDKSLIKNIILLFGLQGANYIVPLLTLPYLVRVLGPVGYGGLNFSIAIIQYFSILTDYGFNLSATRQISIIRADKEKLSELFWTVMICKIILAMFGFAFLSFISLIFSDINKYYIVLVCAYTLVIGNVLFPVWLFQGMEKMGMITIANISAKIISIPLIFVFVDEPSDVWLAGLLNGVTSIVTGIITLIAIKRYKWVLWFKPTMSSVKREFICGWHIFLSTAAISLYTVSITVILGVVTGPVAVGYYTAADKIRQAVQGLISPVSQAVYPKINAVMAKDKNSAFAMIRKLLIIQGSGAFILSLILFIFSKDIILIAYGNNYFDSVLVLRLLSWLPFFVSLSNVFGVQTLLVLGLNKIFSRIVILSGVFSLFLIFPLVSSVAQTGAAITVFITEFMVTLIMMIIIIKRKIPIFRE